MTRHGYRAACWGIVSFFWLALAAQSPAHAAASDDLPHPAPGYTVALFAEGMPSVREMALAPGGVLFAGSMSRGAVYAAYYDPAHPERPATVRVLARGLERPAGVAFHDGDLYVSNVSRILVMRDVLHHLRAPPALETAVDGLPWRPGDHDWKFIAFGPDGLLYVPIGAPCNICAVGTDFGKLMRMRPDGSGREDLAYGIRNSVGFDWQPGSGALWFTDNGRDWLGDDAPSDELNRVAQNGSHFGYPYCHQGDLPDPKFGEGHPCSSFVPPVAKLGAHVAALGMRFYEGASFPGLHGAVLVAEHGSWNRSTPAGYRVVAVDIADPSHPRQQVLLDFLGQDGTVQGRPADVLPLADGSLLVSDDMNGVIYRLTYTGTPPSP